LKDAAARTKYLQDNPDYARARIMSDGYELGLADIKGWLEYNQLPSTGGWRDRYLLDNPDFFEAVTAAQQAKGQTPWKLPDQAKVNSIQYDQLVQQYSDLFAKYDKADSAGRQKLFAENPAFKDAYYTRDGYDKGFSSDFVDDYANYMMIPAAGYGRERYLKEHPEYYREAFRLLGWKEPIDFDKVPSARVENLYNQYLMLSTADKLKYRLANPDLDSWLVLTGKVTKPAKQETATTTTPTTTKPPVTTKPTSPRPSGTLGDKAAGIDAALAEIEGKLAGIK
jgi:hypothetical protein